MSQANASKSGMGMWPGAYLLKSPSDTSLADIIYGGGGRGRGCGRELEVVACCVMCDVVLSKELGYNWTSFPVVGN